MTSTLATALSGLRISQQQIGVISANVSNVGTPGYTRKILPQSTQVVDGQAIGVTPDTVIRNVNLNLTRNLWTQISAAGDFEIQETYLKRVEQFASDLAWGYLKGHWTSALDQTEFEKRDYFQPQFSGH